MFSRRRWNDSRMCDVLLPAQRQQHHDKIPRATTRNSRETLNWIELLSFFLLFVLYVYRVARAVEPKEMTNGYEATEVIKKTMYTPYNKHIYSILPLCVCVFLPKIVRAIIIIVNIDLFRCTFVDILYKPYTFCVRFRWGSIHIPPMTRIRRNWNASPSFVVYGRPSTCEREQTHLFMAYTDWHEIIISCILRQCHNICYVSVESAARRDAYRWQYANWQANRVKDPYRVSLRTEYFILLPIFHWMSLLFLLHMLI